MKFKALCIAASAMALAGLLTACGPTDISSGTYTVNQTGQAAETAMGTIIAATPVKVNSSGPGVGTLAGAVAGGVAGTAIGGGTRANILGGLGGALVGGALGNYAENKLTTQTGMQYSVKLRNGKIFTVAQGMNPVLAVGQRVMVIFSNPARVVAAY